MMVPATPSSEERDSGSHYPLDGVYQDWDNMAEVRKRIRWNKNLIQHVDPQTSQPTNEYVEKTLANLRENRVQLKPMFHRTRAHQLQLPMIDGVIEEIRNLYMASKITVSYDFLYQQAWADDEALREVAADLGIEIQLVKRKRNCSLGQAYPIMDDSQWDDRPVATPQSSELAPPNAVAPPAEPVAPEHAVAGEPAAPTHVAAEGASAEKPVLPEPAPAEAEVAGGEGGRQTMLEELAVEVLESSPEPEHHDDDASMAVKLVEVLEEIERLSLSAAPALEVKEVNGSELVGKPLAEPAAEHVEGPGDKGSPPTHVMESLPTGDNTDTQVPISPASYEHTASMKAMLKNEDEKLAALQKGKAEAPLQPERASSSGGPIQRAKTKLYVSSPKSGAPKTKGRACAQKKKEVLEAVTRKAAGKSAKKKEAPPPELFDHYVACVTEACKDCVESECNHPDFDLTVPHDSFKISPYWTRGHVGVKASNDLLAESATKAKKKSGKNTESSKKVPKSRNVRQIANFSEPGCVYINYAMGQVMVRVRHVHGKKSFAGRRSTGAGGAFIFLVLLVAWTTNLPSLDKVNYLEVFAGVGNVFSEVRAASYTGVACELDFGESFGFEKSKNPFNFLDNAGYALLIWLVLNCEEDRFWAMFANPCSSWVHLNAGTSRRSILNPCGDERHKYIRDANCLASRTLSQS
ncbi:unnamed protein product [Durusdinium trenchii]|uniref:Uncharacterized protein n=1 Tax=Durusdinium trenchii TaxID=1381693 RepID=A0ABP0I871_9DINO